MNFRRIIALLVISLLISGNAYAEINNLSTTISLADWFNTKEGREYIGAGITTYYVGDGLDDNLTNNSTITPNISINGTNNMQTTVYQESLIQTSTVNTDINLSLLYNNAYSESVLLPGEELTAILKVKNNNLESEINLSAIVTLYDINGKMIDMNIESICLEAAGQDSLYNKIVVPDEDTVANAKIMIWESTTSMKPCTSPIILTLSGNDFFGDDYNLSQAINGKNKANGKINGINDPDVFSFVPQNDGLYYFEALSDIDTYAYLYSDNNLFAAISSDDNSGNNNNFRLSATLEAGVTYYLYVNARTDGEYALNYGYSIGNVYGTVSPVKFYDDDTEFNSEIEANVELNTYYTGEFVASMHLKDWSESSNEYASYSMTGIHSGDYLVKIKRPGYLTCYKKISLADNAVDLGSITLIPGDVNGDDIINFDDVNLVNNLLGIEYGNASYMSSADINSDKVINADDLNLINANLNKNSNEYDGNTNVILIDAETYDSQLIVSGNAAPNTILNCVVFYDGYSIFEGEATGSSEGAFEFVVDLNRSGDYTILVSSDNQAYEATETITY